MNVKNLDYDNLPAIIFPFHYEIASWPAHIKQQRVVTVDMLPARNPFVSLNKKKHLIHIICLTPDVQFGFNNDDKIQVGTYHRYVKSFSALISKW